jgi:hypothetical protein
MIRMLTVIGAPVGERVVRSPWAEGSNPDARNKAEKKAKKAKKQKSKK